MDVIAGVAEVDKHEEHDVEKTGSHMEVKAELEINWWLRGLCNNQPYLCFLPLPLLLLASHWLPG